MVNDPTLEIGDIVFVKNTRTIITRLIAAVQHSPFTHVAMYVGNGMIIEANGFIRTRVVPLAIYNGEYQVYRINGLTDVQKRNILCYALSKVGTQYDYEKIIGLFIRLEFLKHFKGFDEKNRFICSELIDRALRAGNVPRRSMDNFGNVSPSELFTYYRFERVNTQSIA